MNFLFEGVRKMSLLPKLAFANTAYIVHFTAKTFVHLIYLSNVSYSLGFGVKKMKLKPTLVRITDYTA